MTNQKNFTEGKILVPLLKFAVPVLLALFLQSLYGAVDLMIVGKFADPADVDKIRIVEGQRKITKFVDKR